MKPKTEKPSGGWSSIRRQLTTCSKPALVALVKELYDHASDNRDFLTARFQAEDDGGVALEKYRSKIVEQFFPRYGFGKLKLGEARKAIRDYRKATGNLAGTLELMMTYVENGTRFTCMYGCDEESFYNSLESVLRELAQLLLKEGAELYPRFESRLLKVESDASNVGWGYCDTVSDQVQMLADTLGKEEETTPLNAPPKEQP